MSVIDEVKSRIDIVDLIGEQVSLQRAGRSFKAVCPFHSERTPSFIVSPERQTWHCFGACGTGGDVFSFVMKREEIEFGEALRQLADRAGVSLGPSRAPEEDERHQRLLQANEAAAAFFHNALLRSQAGEAARSYLDTRGLDSETIEAFELGYSLDSWDVLKSHLTERGFSDEELLAAGLLVESDRGGYDRFRARLMFPIRDERGHVVGFGGRAMPSSEQGAPDGAGAKYINTPQTPLFDKSGLLYALDRAKEAIRRERQVIVVEGYMDAIAAHQHGMSNVVASMGTALTERQIRTLERFKAKILLALDADAAGIEATLRALQEAEAAGAVRAVSASAHPTALPNEEFSEQSRQWSRNALKRAAVTFYVVPLSGKDPDEMIRAERGAWDDAVANAKPFTDHVFDVLASRKELAQPNQRAELLQELLPVIRLIEEPVYRAHYIQRLARLAQVEEDVVRTQLRQRPARSPRQAASAPQPPTPPTFRDKDEEFSLALLLRYPALREEGKALERDFYHLSENRAVLTLWQQTADIELIRQMLPTELHEHLEQILGKNLPVYEMKDLHTAFKDCVLKIEFRRLSTAKQASGQAFSETRALELENAVAYEQDMKAGLRLHQLTLERRRIWHERFSPQREGKQ